MKGLIFTYVLTYGGAVAALSDPFKGLLVYVCFAIVRPESMWSWSVSGGSYSRIVAIALLAGWAGKGFGNWAFGRANAIVYCLLGFFALYVASAIAAPNQGVAWGDVEAKAKVILPFIVGATIITSKEQLKQLAWAIMLSQGYVAFELNLSYFQGFNKILEIGFAGMDNNCNAIAMVCGAGFAFFMGLAAEKAWARWLCFAAAGLMAHSIMIAQSRGGMLALIMTGIVTFLLIPKRPAYFAYLFLAIVVGLRLAGPSVWERFNTAFAEEGERDESAESRLDLWKACGEIMASSPLLGIGPHHFPLIAHEYGFTKGKEAHSTWMQLGAEIGIPGLFFLVTFYVMTMWRLWVMARTLDATDPATADNCRMVIASLCGFMIAAQFVTLTGLEIPYYVALVGAGYLKLSDALAQEAHDHSFVERESVAPTPGRWRSVQPAI